MTNRVLATGILESEGPVAMEDDSLYVVEMAGSRACITHISAEGEARLAIKTGGRPNGLTIDGDGRLWVAEARAGVVLCLEPDGTEVRRIEGFEGRRFLWPNDLRFGPDGQLYLTDSGILDTDFMDGIRIVPHYQELPYDGAVYQIDPVKARVARRLDGGIRFTNGLAFGPDDRLYVNETLSGAVFRYDVFGAAAPRREPFGNVNRPDRPAGAGGPDGMAFGNDGRLYCTVYGQGDVTVLGPDGAVVGRHPTNGLRPTNIAFARSGKRAFITEVLESCVEIMELPCEGLPLHRPKLAL